ncbi:hypothetical protein HBI81_260130 [Parastagonospora nodorum]|nr:hypothetical protein HBI26_253000 [Parastagonospora nodorum]KAH5617638.1 hypothetical protein HBI23_251960 [Parastagonospora nodorum]KAH5707146.1 hypothetical protein HBI18_251260 [Parastagonospora nodorum]KAH6383660.1 hypothetical protein HBI60_254980 [Parastagonospora nodorum]KAH6510374.1 hypothetical protein HBI81_260130 [Parastagonospora nodorum]
MLETSSKDWRKTLPKTYYALKELSSTIRVQIPSYTTLTEATRTSRTILYLWAKLPWSIVSGICKERKSAARSWWCPPSAIYLSFLRSTRILFWRFKTLEPDMTITNNKWDAEATLRVHKWLRQEGIPTFTTTRNSANQAAVSPATFEEAKRSFSIKHPRRIPGKGSQKIGIFSGTCFHKLFQPHTQTCLVCQKSRC